MNAPLYVGQLPHGAGDAQVAYMAAPVVPGMNGKNLARAGTDGELYTDLTLTGLDAAGGIAVGARSAGAAGAAVSGAVNVVSTTLHNNRTEQQLLDLYRDTVASQLGMAPEQVSVDNLREAAERFAENKALRAEFAAMDEKSVTSPVRAAITSVAALAGGAAGALAGGGIASMATGLAGSMAAGSAAGKALDAIMGKDGELTPFGALQQADAKLQSGEGVSAMDMFQFHVASDPDLARHIEGHMGERFQDLSDEKKSRTMLRDHPMLTELCKYEAYLLNSKSISAGSLMDGRVQMDVQAEFEQSYLQAQTPSLRVTTGDAVVSRLAPSSQIVVPSPAAVGAHTQALAQQRAQTGAEHSRLN